MNYYNEFDPKAAAWLQQLINRNIIPNGHVDTRSITDVTASDLAGYTQCHFFAGIGGWSRALFLAGIPSTTPLWTGSCPCQPFSNAGKRRGTEDERHLWPTWKQLISQCKPPIVFGEQVASADGRNWLASVRSDLETLDYAVGAADLCAAGIGAPHIRQRLYFVGQPDADGGRCQQRNAGLRHLSIPDQNCKAGGMGNADSIGARGDGESVSRKVIGEDGKYLPEHADAPSNDGNTDEVHSFWRDADWLWCRDGKWRPVEPGTFPLANGIPARVGRLRGYGNAIVPQVAATFIRATLM
jgi:DNA (cytosine-5)-methyltransferase 1